MKCQQNNTTHMTRHKLPPSRKYYLYLQTHGRTAWAAQLAKSMSLTKVIDTVISFGSFVNQFVIIKLLLHSERLKQHIVTIGVFVK